MTIIAVLAPPHFTKRPVDPKAIRLPFPPDQGCSGTHSRQEEVMVVAFVPVSYAHSLSIWDPGGQSRVVWEEWGKGPLIRKHCLIEKVGQGSPWGRRQKNHE